MNPRISHVIRVAGLTAVLTMGLTARAADYEIDWFTFGAGDMFSTGGPYELSGAVMQAGADTLAGGDYEMTGGFWAGVPPFELGDLNCDGVINAFDIDPFVLALTDPAGYDAKFPDCDRMLADINEDGKVDAFDIDPFVELLTGA